jgi:hypothetical protein
VRGRKKLTDLDVDRTLAECRAWLVENGEAKPDDDFLAAQARHWDRHTQVHADPCYANPCKAAAVCAVMAELLTYGQAGPSAALLDALASAADRAAAELSHVPLAFAKSLGTLQQALHHQHRNEARGYRPFEDGSVFLNLPELATEGEAILAGLRSAAVDQGPRLRAFASRLRDTALWPGDHDARTRGTDHLLLSATQHLHAAGFVPAEIAKLVIDQGDHQTRPHSRHLKSKKRRLAVDRVGQRLSKPDHRIFYIVTPERSAPPDPSGRQTAKASA